MKNDLNTMTRKELEKLKASVEKALEKLAQKDMKAALAAAEKAAAAHGYSLAELSGDVDQRKTKKARTGPKKVSQPKYKNPANPAQTWTGKGRQPDWFKAAIAAGKAPEAMEI